jgi:hypothetical protein
MAAITADDDIRNVHVSSVLRLAVIFQFGPDCDRIIITIRSREHTTKHVFCYRAGPPESGSRKVFRHRGENKLAVFYAAKAQDPIGQVF